jgi:hypothetical protein
LRPKKAFSLSKPVQVRISGLAPSGLTDALGRLIDGNHDGQPGGDAVAILSRSNTRIAARWQTGALPNAAVTAVEARPSAGSQDRRLQSLVSAALGAWGSDKAAAGSDGDDRATARAITIVDNSARRASDARWHERRALHSARKGAAGLEAIRPPAVGPAPRRRAMMKATSKRFPDPKSDGPVD